MPDENTIRDFKDALRAKALEQELFELFIGTLQVHGIVAKEGSIVDASFIDVPKQRNSKEENADIKAGAVPLSFGEKDKNGKQSKLAQKYIQSRWAVKHKQTHFGAKNHVNVDAKTKLINRFVVTDAARHDSQVIDQSIN